MTAFPGDRFDAVVVGGGIYGILLALVGAARNQRVLLVERDDFGAGATSNHLRTIHGGLRYLQFLDIRRAIDSNRQRLWWLRHFPDLVHPISCLMPLYGEGLRRAETFYAAFLVARMLGLHRDAEGRAGRFEVVGTDQVEAMLPLCRRGALDRGAVWQDAFMPRPHRVVAELLHWAESAGAEVRSRTEFVSASRNGDRWNVALTDRKTGEQGNVSARWILNAAGSGTNEVIRRMAGIDGSPVLVPTFSWGLLIDRPPLSDCSVAVAPPGPGRRTYFVHPYHGRILAGTGHAGISARDTVPSEVSEAQIAAVLDDLNEALPGAELKRQQVRHVFAGVLPGLQPGSDALLMHPQVVDHGRRDSAPGAWTVLGVKFTEAPFVAHRLWSRLLKARPRALPPRPSPRRVPSIEEANGMSDSDLRRVLTDLAAAEWVACADDVLWRRTDLWMDEAQRRRVGALLE